MPPRNRISARTKTGANGMKKAGLLIVAGAPCANRTHSAVRYVATGEHAIGLFPPVCDLESTKGLVEANK